jgi:hypothetical protein
MKVIHQLIAYFRERGELTDHDLKRFAQQGYWGEYTSADLQSLQHKLNQPYFFQVTGNTNGPLWGTDTYTSDSNLGTACVHAGVLKPGEAGVVKVTMVKPLAVFVGSARNGVHSSTWTSGWNGAFQVDAVGG